MCGIIGVYGNNNAARVAAVGLFAEQHRGQESCGMAVGDGFLIRLHKKMGLVKEVFHNEQLSALPGNIAIGMFVILLKEVQRNLIHNRI